jgi:hypothetical protein
VARSFLNVATYLWSSAHARQTSSIQVTYVRSD